MGAEHEEEEEEEEEEEKVYALDIVHRSLVFSWGKHAWKRACGM